MIRTRSSSSKREALSDDSETKMNYTGNKSLDDLWKLVLLESDDSDTDDVNNKNNKKKDRFTWFRRGPREIFAHSDGESEVGPNDQDDDDDARDEVYVSDYHYDHHSDVSSEVSIGTTVERAFDSIFPAPEPVVEKKNRMYFWRNNSRTSGEENNESILSAWFAPSEPSPPKKSSSWMGWLVDSRNDGQQNGKAKPENRS